jgi:hypothetical protein
MIVQRESGFLAPIAAPAPARRSPLSPAAPRGTKARRHYNVMSSSPSATERSFSLDMELNLTANSR